MSPEPSPDPGATASPLWEAVAIPTPAQNRRRFLDRLARRIVSTGGIGIIACVLAILVFILLEVAPLLKGPEATFLPPLRLGGVEGEPLLVGTEEYQELGYAVLPDGEIRVFPMEDPTRSDRRPLPALAGRRITAASHPPEEASLALGTQDGCLLPVSLLSRADHDGSRRHVSIALEPGALLQLDPERRPLTSITHRARDGVSVSVGISADGRLLYSAFQECRSMAGGVQRQQAQKDLTGALPGPPTALAVDPLLEHLYVGTRDGQVVHVDLADPLAPTPLEAVRVTRDAVTCLAILIGGQTLVVGDAEGRVGAWLRATDGAVPPGKSLRLVREFGKHPAAVAAITVSQRDKGFATLDASGGLKLHHNVTGTLLDLRAEEPARALFMAPRANGLYALHGGGRLSRWRLRNPHPEFSLRALFGKVWYEGYDAPEHIWQSTGGTDDFEPKFGLVPLLFGTLKGTLYALLFAVPLAVMGALFAAQFMHPSLKGVVKPAIEIMAGLPSVVLGFLAGLWMAPHMERVMPACLAMGIALPAASLAAMGLWRALPPALRKRWHEGTEILLLLPVLVGAAWACLALNGALEAALFDGSFRRWWLAATGLPYDQRNALVVGIAMGFAVIPIIFTISEDALSNVPRHLVSGSLALGATRWQTAIRVVLPTASPGIFSAVMVGFGRAVGETMIVLMATGNTPIMEWNILNGFRTLSANIAVEIPEAPHGGTLYRILFFAALLLFAMTFLVNTCAELIRMRMRARYAKL